MTSLSPFHLAIAVRDIDEAREFYGAKLGFPEGRSSDQWIDFNMLGHQLVTHLDPSLGRHGKVSQVRNDVDGHGVPIPHFGVVVQLQDWGVLERKARSVVESFIIPPTVRFEGQAGEQRILFFSDPSGNAIEFKAFANIEKSLPARAACPMKR